METPLHGAFFGRTVSDTFVRIYGVLNPDWSVVLRCVDSSHSVSDLVNILRFHSVEHRVIHGNVCLSLSALRNATFEGLLTGFDELWIIDGNSPDFDLAPFPISTSDAADFSSDLPEGLAEAMNQVSCVLILGDGCGLNYATTLTQIRRELVEEADTPPE